MAAAGASAGSTGCVQAPALVTASNASECLVDAHDTFLFDMDGVLFVGMRMIARSNEAVRRLMALGKRVVFITNNTTKGRKAVLEKLVGMGFEGIELEQIYTSGYATALHLQSLPQLQRPRRHGSETCATSSTTRTPARPKCTRTANA